MVKVEYICSFIEIYVSFGESRCQTKLDKILRLKSGKLLKELLKESTIHIN